jgi:signal peptidase II
MIIKKNFFNFFFILGIFLTDRLSKYLIIEFDKTNVEPEYTILPFLNFNLIWNEGIAFGLFSFADKSNYNILTIIIIFVTAIIFWMIIKTKELEKLGFMMIFGGSLGNIFDRVYYSSVPDFIDIHFYNFHWFIFNVADIFISIGVMLLILLEIFVKKKI